MIDFDEYLLPMASPPRPPQAGAAAGAPSDAAARAVFGWHAMLQRSAGEAWRELLARDARGEAWQAEQPFRVRQGQSS